MIISLSQSLTAPINGAIQIISTTNLKQSVTNASEKMENDKIDNGGNVDNKSFPQPIIH
ncbi:MAG: hypothetical protein MRK00_09205 [Nitrosomonas sp.]|nr:hypothetical protein [Nitrosomonas sp.]